MESQEYKSVTLNDIEDCSECPLLSEGVCSGGWKSGAGGVPIEPPCTNIEEDKDLYEFIDEYYGRIVDDEERLKRLEEEKREKKRKAEIKAERRRYSKIYCFTERRKVDDIKKIIKSIEAELDFEDSFSKAFNITNEIFGYAERKEVNPQLQKEIDLLKSQLAEAEKALKEKQKECRKTQKYIEIGKI